MTKHLLAQKHFRCRVSEAQTLMGQVKTVVSESGPAALEEVVHFRFPVFPQAEAGYLPEISERPAGVHAEAKGGDFAGAAEWRQFFA